MSPGVPVWPLKVKSLYYINTILRWSNRATRGHQAIRLAHFNIKNLFMTHRSLGDPKFKQAFLSNPKRKTAAQRNGARPSVESSFIDIYSLPSRESGFIDPLDKAIMFFDNMSIASEEFNQKRFKREKNPSD